MRITCMLLLALGTLTLAPALAAAGEASGSLEQVLVESAHTPAQHAALAKYYRDKAAAAQEEARAHEMMAKTYSPESTVGKSTWGTNQQRQKMRDHCKMLSQQSAAMAKDYEALAKLHDEEAKKAQ